MPAPKIDPRNYDDIVRQTRELATLYSDWTPRDDDQPDAGSALIGIFGRFMELIVVLTDGLQEFRLKERARLEPSFFFSYDI